MNIKYVNSKDLKQELIIAGWIASVSTDKTNKNDDFYLNVAKHCILSNHGTPTRSMRFVFEINDISRACANEFVRHEIGVTKVQKSQRYVNEEDFSYYLPVSIVKSGNGDMYKLLMEAVKEQYTDLIKAGVPKEDARYVLPNATATSLHVAFNWESLVNFLRRRRCLRAQKEIRDIANAIAELVGSELDNIGLGELKKFLQAPCDFYGKCPEAKPCGKKVKTDNIIPMVKEIKQPLKRVRGFEPVSYAPKDVIIPKRSTKGSAGHDIYSPITFTIPAKGFSDVIWTNIKAYMLEDEFLGVHIRSSIAIKKGIMLVNNMGIIDSDYYNNPDNEGNIGFKFFNLSDKDVTIEKGKRILQGIFYKYALADNDNAESERVSGVGSTGK